MTAYELRISDWSSDVALPSEIEYRAVEFGLARQLDRHGHVAGGTDDFAAILPQRVGDHVGEQEVVLDHENPQSVQASRSSRHGSAFRYSSSAHARQRRRRRVWQTWDGGEDRKSGG